MNVTARSFIVADAQLRAAMLEHGKDVHTESWQGIDIRERPDAVTTELLNVTLKVDLRNNRDLNHWRTECRPNLPWADDHFAERVSGEPLNPPPSWAWWPWNKSAAKHRSAEKFNHTYPERFWPKFAGDDPLRAHRVQPLRGIRWTYGDLEDVIKLLRKEPLTRQAYMPMFFPEDTGIGDGGRKPCTLGYQFIVRDNRLHCFYPMRSCDLMRHFRDDVYLAIRLMLWVIEQCSDARGDTPKPVKHAFWQHVTPGSLTMHMTSLHCFVNDMIELRRERDAAIMGGLS